jgi:hypothetical protein
MDEYDRLRLDYEQTTQLLRALLDARFKLLAFIPTIAVAAVGFFGTPRPGAELVGVGLLGFVATLGVFLYELRNSQLEDALVQRATELEAKLGFPSAFGGDGRGGFFSERPAGMRRVAGFLPAAHERGVALVYGAALGGWTYLLAWGVLASIEIDAAQNWGAAVGVLAGVAAFVEVERTSRQRAEPPPPPDPRTRAA